MSHSRNLLRNPDFLSGFFFIFLGIIVCILSVRLNLGNLFKPGPGFFPFFGGLTLTFLSVTILVQAYGYKEWKGWEINVNWIVVSLVSFSMAVFAFLLERIGFVFITFLFVSSIMRVYKFKSWKEVIFVGFLSAMSSYILFNILLKVPLPKSFLKIF